MLVNRFGHQPQSGDIAVVPASFDAEKWGELPTRVQERFRNHGSSSPDLTWQVPVTFKYSNGAGTVSAAAEACKPASAQAFATLIEGMDKSLGDLLEGIVLHAFEGKAPFSAETQLVIAQLKEVYGCKLTADDSHRLVENGA